MSNSIEFLERLHQSENKNKHSSVPSIELKGTVLKPEYLFRVQKNRGQNNKHTVFEKNKSETQTNTWGIATLYLPAQHTATKEYLLQIAQGIPVPKIAHEVTIPIPEWVETPAHPAFNLISRIANTLGQILEPTAESFASLLHHTLAFNHSLKVELPVLSLLANPTELASHLAQGESSPILQSLTPSLESATMNAVVILALIGSPNNTAQKLLTYAQPDLEIESSGIESSGEALIAANTQLRAQQAEIARQNEQGLLSEIEKVVLSDLAVKTAEATIVTAQRYDTQQDVVSSKPVHTLLKQQRTLLNNQRFTLTKDRSQAQPTPRSIANQALSDDLTTKLTELRTDTQIQTSLKESNSVQNNLNTLTIATALCLLHDTNATLQKVQQTLTAAPNLLQKDITTLTHSEIAAVLSLEIAFRSEPKPEQTLQPTLKQNLKPTLKQTSGLTQEQLKQSAAIIKLANKIHQHNIFFFNSKLGSAHDPMIFHGVLQANGTFDPCPIHSIPQIHSLQASMNIASATPPFQPPVIASVSADIALQPAISLSKVSSLGAIGTLGFTFLSNLAANNPNKKNGGTAHKTQRTTIGTRNSDTFRSDTVKDGRLNGTKKKTAKQKKSLPKRSVGYSGLFALAQNEKKHPGNDTHKQSNSTKQRQQNRLSTQTTQPKKDTVRRETVTRTQIIQDGYKNNAKADSAPLKAQIDAVRKSEPKKVKHKSADQKSTTRSSEYKTRQRAATKRNDQRSTGGAAEKRDTKKLKARSQKKLQPKSSDNSPKPRLLDRDTEQTIARKVTTVQKSAKPKTASKKGAVTKTESSKSTTQGILKNTQTAKIASGTKSETSVTVNLSRQVATERSEVATKTMVSTTAKETGQITSQASGVANQVTNQVQKEIAQTKASNVSNQATRQATSEVTHAKLSKTVAKKAQSTHKPTETANRVVAAPNTQPQSPDSSSRKGHTGRSTAHTISKNNSNTASTASTASTPHSAQNNSQSQNDTPTVAKVRQKGTQAVTISPATGLRLQAERTRIDVSNSFELKRDVAQWIKLNQRNQYHPNRHSRYH